MKTKTILTLVIVILIIICGSLYIKDNNLFTAVPAIDTTPAPQNNDGESPADIDTTTWIYSEPSGQGTQFMYPKMLTTKYVTASEWPPKLEMSAGDYVCVESAGDNVGPQGRVEKHIVGTSATEYCVKILNEGAAGSTYTSYEYTTKQGDFVPKLSFTLRFPQCMNYNEPNQSACKAEQKSFDVDALADKIISSIRMR